MKKLLLFILLVCSRITNAQTYVLIPDPQFVFELQNTIPAAMNGNSLNISSPLVTTTTKTLILYALSNLTGIQYFTSLTNLSVQNGSLTSLPILPNTIKVLNCSTNQITAIANLPDSLRALY